jgi:deoxyribodipyrimidine photo-lyase
MKGLVWFREDLRVNDNTALHHAATNCKDGMSAVFFIDKQFWSHHDMAPVRQDFLLQGIELLQADLARLHIDLHVIELTQSSQLSKKLLELMTDLKADALFFNKQYEVNELKRDDSITQLCEKNNYSVYSYHDQIILEPGSVLSLKGEPFSVFTAFKRAWYKVFTAKHIRLLSKPKLQKSSNSRSLVKFDTAKPSDSLTRKHWPSGEAAAKKRLKTFLAESVFNYDKTRDFPSVDGTSQLSPYLACGMISPRECFIAALLENDNELDTGNAGAITWMSELIWRDFYKHILVTTPRISMHQPYKLATNIIQWLSNDAHLKAWQTGQTGFPLIDAAMRQLNTTGWMHNRLRMVVAMFFTKNLFLDWRVGEHYFIQHLIDGDLSANNGGWQWCASTGTDAAPYFRIFNPIRQSERFDPQGEFILKYCPELIGFDKKSIHDPYAHMPLIASQQGYPRQIIDLKVHRDKVLKAFKDTNTG